MAQTSKYVRLKAVITVLFKYGIDEVLNRTNLINHLPAFLKPSESRLEHIQNTSWTTRIRLALEELGPAYVKLGQIMSTRPDIIPTELIEELEKLQDQVVANNLQIKEILQSEYAPELFDRITDLSSHPLASASISQVYSGILDGIHPVIFKIQRPEARMNVLADIQLMRDLIILVEKLDSGLKNMNFLQLIDTFEQNMIEELNFIQEKENTILFKKQNGTNEKLHIPTVYEDFCTSEVLCIEQVQGIRISDFNQHTEIPITSEELVNNYIETFLDQVLVHGFFHADPHPGNVFVDQYGKIIFIDFGSVGHLNRQEINAVQNILIYFLLKNTEKLIEVVKGLALVYKIPDERKLKLQVDELVNIFSSKDINKVDFTVLIDKFTKISKKNRIVFPHSIYLLVRGIALIEGTVRQLIPEINLGNMFKPHLLKLVNGKFNKEALLTNLVPMTFEALDLMRTLPIRLNRLSHALTTNNFAIQVKDSPEKQENQLLRLHLAGYYCLLIVLLILTFIQVKYTVDWDLKNILIITTLSGLLLLILYKMRIKNR